MSHQTMTPERIAEINRIACNLDRENPAYGALNEALDALESAQKEIADLKRGGVVVLDACCGSRMMWFDRKDPRAVFVDRRQESHILPDKSSKGGYRTLEVRPDVVADFTALPFEDGCFAHLAFDPPHFTRNGAKGWVGLKYGTLSDGWQGMLTKGFEECFRVLAPGGTLVFKWCESDIPLRDVLALTPHAPLYGNKYPKRAGTHWIVWVKDLDHLAASRSRTIPADRVLGEGEERVRWISVDEAIPEDRQNIGFIVDCNRDGFLHGRVYGGNFNARDFENRFGGFQTHGFSCMASHWFPFPPVSDALRAQLTQEPTP